MLLRMSLPHKFIFLSVVLSASIIILTLVNILRLNTMGHHIESIEKKDIPLTKLITAITEHQLEQEIYFEQAYRFSLEIETEAHARASYNHAKKEFSAYDQKVKTEVKRAEQLLHLFIENSSEPQLIAEFKKLLGQMIKIDHHHETWSTHAKEILHALENKQLHEAALLAVSADKESSNLEHEVLLALEEIERFTEQAIMNLDEEESKMLSQGIIITIIALIITTWLSIYMVRRIHTDTDKLNYSINKLKLGELHNNFKSRNISKDLWLMLNNLDELRETLSSTISTINDANDKITSKARNVTELTSQLVIQIENQNSEINMLAVALEEMGATSTDIAKNSENTQISTTDANQLSTLSQNDMNDAINAMQKLTTSMTASSKNITALEQHGQNITSVLDVIKGIADQTNLLALNAAIEAARAGEQGRGFAVVADEVRTLAQRTQDSTTEIENMIKGFKNETDSAVKGMNESKSNSDFMLVTSEKSNNNLIKISESISDINDMTTQIADAAEQQSIVVNELSKNINSVNDLSTRNLESVVEISATSEEFSELANQSKQLINFFKMSSSA